MASTVDGKFVDYSVRKLEQLAARIQDCLKRLSDRQVWERGGGNQNSIGNLVLHLTGNVRQWILSGVGGAPDVRKRDSEFAARDGMTAEELSALLDSTVRDVVSVIAGLGAERLVESRRIQGYEVTVLEAVYSVVEHFGQHTGQIIFATKAFTGDDLGYYAHTQKTP